MTIKKNVAEFGSESIVAFLVNACQLPIPWYSRSCENGGLVSLCCIWCQGTNIDIIFKIGWFCDWMVVNCLFLGSLGNQCRWHKFLPLRLAWLSRWWYYLMKDLKYMLLVDAWARNVGWSKQQRGPQNQKGGVWGERFGGYKGSEGPLHVPGQPECNVHAQGWMHNQRRSRKMLSLHIGKICGLHASKWQSLRKSCRWLSYKPQGVSFGFGFYFFTFFCYPCI